MAGFEAIPERYNKIFYSKNVYRKRDLSVIGGKSKKGNIINKDKYNSAEYK